MSTLGDVPITQANPIRRAGAAEAVGGNLMFTKTRASLIPQRPVFTPPTPFQPPKTTTAPSMKPTETREAEQRGITRGEIICIALCALAAFLCLVVILALFMTIKKPEDPVVVDKESVVRVGASAELKGLTVADFDDGNVRASFIAAVAETAEVGPDDVREPPSRRAAEPPAEGRGRVGCSEKGRGGGCARAGRAEESRAPCARIRSPPRTRWRAPRSRRAGLASAGRGAAAGARNFCS